MCKKTASKLKENGGSTNSYFGASNMKKNEENLQQLRDTSKRNNLLQVLKGEQKEKGVESLYNG